MDALRDLAGASDDDDDDDAFDQDMDALRRACLITGADPDLFAATAAYEVFNSLGDGEDNDDDEDDFALLRNLQNRFGIPSDASEHGMFMPISSLPPDCSDDSDADDFETLRAIHKRFAAYDNEPSMEKEPVRGPSVSLQTKSSSELCITSSAEERPCASAERNLVKPSTSQPNYSNFPKSANLFMDAIKKNRSFQKLLRGKLVQFEAKIEENKKLMERVKILKDFQVNCKKRTGRALSLKKDCRVQLISEKKAWPTKDYKVLDRKMPAMYYGPSENPRVANFKAALTNFPLSLDRKKWSDAERENIEKGIRQQFQEMVLQNMVDRPRDAGESGEELNDLDSVLISIKDLNVTSEDIKLFLPRVNWEQVASIYVAGRSGAECETRWLNFEDPLINRDPWTAQEDKTLLFNVQNKGISNWFEISASLGTNRTPFQCLSRYQRSLNVSILKREWTKDEDAKLRSAVEAFGEHNWQEVAASLEGWTGSQCANRWNKSLHPGREKVGRWTTDEDKRLTVAQMLFGPRNWKKTACFVPGRTEVQCRERWVNSLDPSLTWEKWTKEEDSKLREAILEHGYCWAKVAADLPRRTDNMCRRRWKRLDPHELQYLQAARKMQKAALIGNFVDRESERPAIGLNDFCPLPLLPAERNVDSSCEQTEILRIDSGKKKSKYSRKVKKTSKLDSSEECTQTASESSFVTKSNGETEVSDRQDQETRLGGKRKKRARKLNCEKGQVAEANEDSLNSASNNSKAEHVGESRASKNSQNGTASSKRPKSRNTHAKLPKEHDIRVDNINANDRTVYQKQTGTEQPCKRIQPNGMSGLHQNDESTNNKSKKPKLQEDVSLRQENGFKCSAINDGHAVPGRPNLFEDASPSSSFVDRLHGRNDRKPSSTEHLGSKEDGAEDDMNLASFMRSISKKKRLKPVKDRDKLAEPRGNFVKVALVPAGVKPNGTFGLHRDNAPISTCDRANTTPSVRQENGFGVGETTTEDPCDALEEPNSTEDAAPCSLFIDRIDGGNDQNPDRVAALGSPERVGAEDDMPLSCFMRSISKKRRLNPAKN